MNIHEKYMKQCLSLAEKALGFTHPNPMVGCVIVHNNVIVAEGYHELYGEAHAEVNAIKVLPKEIEASNCTLYVNLEPCSHHGKTPPCADLIVKKGFRKVVIGSLDPNPLVAGFGIEKLKDNGIEIVCNVLEKECLALNKRFYTFHQKKRPYYTLKWAQSKDGFIYNPELPAQITGEESNRLVHKIRAQEAAILIGANTLINDNPQLNVRHVDGPDPIAVVLCGSIPEELYTSYLYNKAAKLIVLNEEKSERQFEGRVRFVKLENSRDLSALNQCFLQLEINSILVEGGRKTLDFFIRSKTLDEAIQITGNKIFKKGLNSPETNELTCENSINIGEDKWEFLTLETEQ